MGALIIILRGLKKINKQSRTDKNGAASIRHENDFALQHGTHGYIQTLCDAVLGKWRVFTVLDKLAHRGCIQHLYIPDAGHPFFQHRQSLFIHLILYVSDHHAQIGQFAHLGQLNFELG
ncbi:hypothetical protein D3C71_1599530 [compost metagenome]